MSRFRSEFAAALLGALSVFGFAPFHLFPLPLVTLALLFALWRQAPNPLRAAWLGWWWGMGCFLGGVSWIYVSLHDVGGMPAPIAATATFLFCGVLALYPALAGWLFNRFKCGSAMRDALLVAAVWMVTEWLRGWLLTGFPWLAIGYAQTPPSPLAGYAAVLGVYGIGFLSALLAALAAFALRRPLLPSSLLTMLFIPSFGFLLQHMDWTHPTGAPLTVSLLQGNISQETKWDRERVPFSLKTYARLVQSYPAQLVVLPETALPMFLEEVPEDYLLQITERSSILTGVAVLTHPANQPSGYANAAVMLTRGAQSQGYAKTHLVPFGEYVPTGFEWFLALMHMPMSDFSAGPQNQPPLEIAGQRIAPNICYEDLFGEEIIRALPQATLLINLSNTAWFGDSLAQPQHLQIAQMRALETGRPMLRSTNTGMTAAIRPDGHVMAVLPAFTAAGLTVEVQGHAGMTPYARWGNALALLIATISLLPALLQRRENLRQQHIDQAMDYSDNPDHAKNEEDKTTQD